MTGKVIRPFQITPASIISTNVVEPTTLWLIDTVYSIGNEAHLDTTGRVYRSIINGNGGHDPSIDDGTHWIDIGPTNKMSLFDSSVRTQTTGTDTIEYSLQTYGYNDGIAFFNLTASEVRIVAMDGLTEVADITISLLNDGPIVDIWSYLFEELSRRKDCAYTSLPLIADLIFNITVSNNGDVGAGVLVVGALKDLGIILRQVRIGRDDYSLPDFNEYGEYDPILRGSAKRGTFPALVPRDMVDDLVEILDGYRTIPCAWIMSEKYSRGLLYAIYQNLEFVSGEHADYDECDYVLKGLI